MAYSELIKKFDRVREYMREFYVYGFRSRDEVGRKSARTYDDERRRIESYLGDYMSFTRNAAGKSVFFSVDSHKVLQNPLYRAWKAKSFTDGDITLHFVLFDLLYSSEIWLTHREITEQLHTNYLAAVGSPMQMDDSTVRKKLKEYVTLGLLKTDRRGGQVYYARTEAPQLAPWAEALAFFSEEAPAGVIGSFLLDKLPEAPVRFVFKHHYIVPAMDSGIVCALLCAIQDQCAVTLRMIGRRIPGKTSLEAVPLRLFFSVQGGRQYLLAHEKRQNRLKAYRLDNILEVTPGPVEADFEALHTELDETQNHMWGVVTPLGANAALQRVSFTVQVLPDEQHIVGRLQREKRCGIVEQLDDTHYRFTAQVYDSGELLPWMRTFLCRITEVNFSDRSVENRFRADVSEMYRLYGVQEPSVQEDGFVVDGQLSNADESSGIKEVAREEDADAVQ